jgi:glycosyltransferase involved in cell wall biosynthesis
VPVGDDHGPSSLHLPPVTREPQIESRLGLTVDLRPIRALDYSGTGLLLREQVRRLANRPSVDLSLCVSNLSQAEFEGVRLVRKPDPYRSQVVYVPQQILRARDCAVFAGPWSVVVNHLDTILTDYPSYHPTGRHRDVLEQLQRWSFQQASVVTTLTESSKRDCLRLEPSLDESKVRVIPCGLDQELPSVGPDVHRASQIGPFVLVLGASVVHKRRPFAVEVFHQMKARGYPGKLILAGPQTKFGSTRADEQKLVTAYGLADEVLQFASVSESDKAWMLHSADIVLCPSEAEGFGLIPSEAGRYGTPALIEGIGAAREIYGDSAVVPSGLMAAGWAERALRLIQTPPEREDLVRQLKSATERYQWSDSTDLLESALRSAARNSQSTSPASGNIRLERRSVRTALELSLLSHRFAYEFRQRFWLSRTTNR